jgi:hypothetical protein
MLKKTGLCFAIIFVLASGAVSYSQDETNTYAKYLTWTALQLLPSPVFIQDSDGRNAHVLFGLRWQVTPINISFRSNKYSTPFQFFMINPVRKFTGSIEIFLQPEWALAGFKYSNLARFGINAGSRITIPVSGDGENLSVSVGGKYNYRKDLIGNKNGFFGIEAGVYAIYGILGIQFSYNFDSRSKYNIGIYFKYF